ncbi:MAG: nicotinate-nucleotide--dimethylbenzimidazole phosphoribosyltransferase, partial [Desulfopila sp.]|nr:nicotinate-nucleotide--dimethylbenzimidazole phosphoribosyltransferase [Desulfopila sp.]
MSTLEKTLSKIFPQDSSVREAARNRLDQLAMPHWALGDLMDLAIDIAGMTKTVTPSIKRKAIVTMAADHGVTVEGVSKFPSEVTQQMVFNFVNGGAGINALARQAGAHVFVVDMGVNCDLTALAQSGKIINKKVGLGTANIAKGPAMSHAMARRSLESGIEIAEELCSD